MPRGYRHIRDYEKETDKVQYLSQKDKVHYFSQKEKRCKK